jgi:CheY-like chemotaxis protein/HPt (histidine-containing phosphotransfer) domain-containing protein
VNRKVALRMLKGFGYNADVAANGLEVLDALARQRYDLVLMDIQMPELDGLDATRRIVKDMPPNTRPRIIAMSANALREDAEAAIQAGVDDYVVKPISVPMLRAALERSGELAAARKGLSLPVPLPATTADMLCDMLDDEHLRSFIDLDPTGEFVAGLVASFAANTRQAFADMRLAMREGRAADAGGLAHQLKGTSSTLGIREMTRLCVALEDMTARGDIVGVPAVVDQCEREFQAGLAALEVFMARHGQGSQPEQ